MHTVLSLCFFYLCWLYHLIHCILQTFKFNQLFFFCYLNHFCSGWIHASIHYNLNLFLYGLSLCQNSWDNLNKLFTDWFVKQKNISDIKSWYTFYYSGPSGDLTLLSVLTFVYFRVISPGAACQGGVCVWRRLPSRAYQSWRGPGCRKWPTAVYTRTMTWDVR